MAPFSIAEFLKTSTRPFLINSMITTFGGCGNQGIVTTHLVTSLFTAVLMSIFKVNSKVSTGSILYPRFWNYKEAARKIILENCSFWLSTNEKCHKKMCLKIFVVVIPKEVPPINPSLV